MFSSRHLQIAVIGTLGLVASCTVFALSMSWENQVRRVEFRDQARRELAVINAALQDANDLVETVRDFVDAGDAFPNREEFTRFAQRVHERASGVRDIGWAPRVLDSEREAFERQIRSSGFPEFEIKERRPSGGLVRAATRPEYFPVLYVDGIEETQRLIGFDLASERYRREAIARALKSGRTAATPPLQLATIKDPRGGVVSFMPISRGQPTSHRDETSLRNGVVWGGFEIAAIFGDVMSKTARFMDTDMYLYDVNGPPNNRLIFWQSPAKETRSPHAEEAVRAWHHWESTVSVFDQQWDVVFAPSRPHKRTAMWHAFIPLSAGLALTAMTVFHLIASLRRNVQLETLTSSLRETTTGLHEKAERIAHMARHDALTGLPNRRFFFEALHHTIERASADKAEFAVMQIDLDGFKPINDFLGHIAGDIVLCEVAHRLRAVSRDGDIIARLGGDEFAAIIEGTDTQEGCESYATRILAALGQPIIAEGAVVAVGASIGIALSPRDGLEPEALMRAADIAMYAAKRQGRATYRYYEPTMDAQIRQRVTLHSDRSRDPASVEPPCDAGPRDGRGSITGQPLAGDRKAVAA